MRQTLLTNKEREGVGGPVADSFDQTKEESEIRKGHVSGPIKMKIRMGQKQKPCCCKIGSFYFYLFFIIMIWGVSFSNSRGSSEMLSFLVLLDDGCSLLPFGAYSLHQNHHHHLHHHYLLFLLASYTYMATSFDYQGGRDV